MAMNEALCKSTKKTRAALGDMDKEEGKTSVPILLSSHTLIAVTIPHLSQPPKEAKGTKKSGEWMGDGQYYKGE